MADCGGKSGDVWVAGREEISRAGVAFDMGGKGIEPSEGIVARGGKGIGHGSGGAVGRWIVDDAFAALGVAPELVDADDVFACAAEGELEIAESFGGLEENAFLLGESVADVAIADAGLGGLAAAEFFDVVEIGFFHAIQSTGWGERQIENAERLKR